MFGSSKNVIGAFLKGYFDGDGCFKENYADAISISKKLILGVCELMLIQGVMPSYYEYVPPKEREILGRKVEQNPNYIVRVPRSFDFVRGTWDGRYKKTWAEDASYFYVPIRSISEEYYCGDVYNLEVEEDHSYTASFAAVCNCQNAEISQARPGELPEMDLLPEKIVELAKQNGCQGISYTYTEPTIFFEYCYDTGLLARKAGLTNSFVTNGYMCPDAVHVAREFLDAARVDLKGDAMHY